MSLDTLRVRWVPASSYTNAPAARCGHVAVAITSEEWGGEFLIVHGGINKNKEALDDLVVLQVQATDLQVALVAYAGMQAAAAWPWQLQLGAGSLVTTWALLVLSWLGHAEQPAVALPAV